MVRVNYKRCGYCGACVGVCKNLAITLEEFIIRIDREKCINCNSCVIVCPLNALQREENV
ncbi:4Fe-4S ferredoxin [Methanocaldococcus villosus KIN24-T80]|uniref:4Fe-4S ferredoxin n=1 Tax=Methanocaldococcus villosus KIN24-T80 TaxID=1069083 RepID=N6V047_9EURY|nr:4Fe-4S binding protein [Methanocaldococcus villosus]ENN95673.1 4Fe-4S ferredoxin [Methanocaldococcus villosus KIN24-T80]